jgi:hypothetical protein
MILTNGRYTTMKGIKVGNNIHIAAKKYGKMTANLEAQISTFRLVDSNGMQIVFEATPISMNNPNENITSIEMTVADSICNKTPLGF